jgi:hypothetical protein
MIFQFPRPVEGPHHHHRVLDPRIDLAAGHSRGFLRSHDHQGKGQENDFPGDHRARLHGSIHNSRPG